jgi:hypothetical protein
LRYNSPDGMRASDDELERKEGNALLRGAGGAGTTRESQEWLITKKCAAESMDFEEMESVMWRKVC